MNLHKSWQTLSLASRFAIAGGAVLLASALIIGSLVTSRIEAAVVRNTANATAQYMDSFISPLSQEISSGDGLSPGARRSLDEIFTGTPLGERVISFKLWSRNGLVVESSDKTIVGKSFPMTDNLRRALAGEVMADFQDLRDAEDAGENALGVPLLEIYSPIREVWSGSIIGVAEFYEVATDLQRELASARINSLITVTTVLLTIGGSLYLIVLQGSRTIIRQQDTLSRKLEELRALSERHGRLRQRVQQAAGRAAAMNDRTLRQVGADLHDGPAQLMSYVALKLDHLRELAPGPAAEAEIDAVAKSVTDAIVDIRQISRGLSLPDIEARMPCAIIDGVAAAHSARTGAAVAIDCQLPDDLALSPAIKICLYRFAQEGLNNGWRHGGGDGQEIRAAVDRRSAVTQGAGPGCRL